MADLIARSIESNIRVALDIPLALPRANADPAQLELALLNLCVNARDAMPDGGTLTIAVDELAVEAEERLGLAAGRYVSLVVGDTGAGMDAETLRRATEPFFTTKGTGKGTGLGFSMVHGLAGQLGGTYALSSTPGQGTRAEIWLPLAAEAVQPAPAGDEDRPAIRSPQRGSCWWTMRNWSAPGRPICCATSDTRSSKLSPAPKRSKCCGATLGSMRW